MTFLVLDWSQVGLTLKVAKEDRPDEPGVMSLDKYRVGSYLQISALATRLFEVLTTNSATHSPRLARYLAHEPSTQPYCSG